MNQLHENLHTLNQTLIDIKSVIEASDKHLHELYKRHITLVSNSEERIKAVQAEVDRLMIEYRPRENTHKTDSGAMM